MRIPGRLIRGSVRPDRRSLARFASLRWAALPIVDRRWTAPLSAVALGFGLFVGVAIGPGTEGTLGGTNPMVIEVPPPENPQTVNAQPDSSRGDGDGEGNANDSNGGDGTSVPAPPSGDSPPVFDTPTTTPPVTTTPPATSYPSTTTDTTTDTTTGGTTDDEDSVEPTTTTLTGTVVHLNPEAASYTIATDDRRLLAVHSHSPPTVGRVVELEARQLANGTYDETGNRDENGKRGQVSFAGTVTFSNPVMRVYTVSGPGVSLLVRGKAQRTPPDVGDQVEVQARIADNVEALPVTPPGEQGCGEPPALPKVPHVGLEQVALKPSDDDTSGDETTTADVEAIVEGVCRDSRKLIVSADDVRESGHDTAIAVPEELRISALKTGQILKLGVEIGDNGALKLTAAASDKATKGAEGEDLVQPGADSESSDDG